MNKQGQDDFRFRDLPGALWHFLDTDRWKYLFFLFVLLAVMFYTMVPPLLIGTIANTLYFHVSGEGGTASPWLPLLSLIGLLAGSYAVVALVRLTAKRVLGRISLNARYRAKVWGFDRLLDHSLAWHQKENTGNKAQRILTGSESVREWTGDMINQLTQGFAAFVGSLVACLLLHPAFIIFFVYYLGILWSIEHHFDKKISTISDQINKSMENASGTFVESASNILAVKAMGAAADMSGSMARREELAKTLSWERLRLSNRKWMWFQMHNALSWAMYLAVIGFMVLDGRLLPGFFLTYAAYWDRLRESSVDFTDKVQVMIERKSNLGRMMSIFRGPGGLSKGTEDFPHDWDGIRLAQASFRYGEKAAMGPLDLYIPRGEVLGVAGHSGSGKSTLIKLLLGLYHLESGTLTIGRVPVASIRHEDLTANVAVVLQETELFNLSLRDNITLMRDLDPELLDQACRVACLDEIIARLPDGLETVVGEKGHALSGGERQRVGIARALCRKAPILLLDEASSALDSLTEARVTKGLMDMVAGGTTVIIVAHRLSTLKDTQRIVVFESGTIVEEGSYEALLDKADSRFRAMQEVQNA